jgi:hypothetical protein
MDKMEALSPLMVRNVLGSSKACSAEGSLSDVRRALCCDGHVSPDSVILIQGGKEADLSLSALEAKQRIRQGVPLFYLVRSRAASVLEFAVRMGVARENITVPCTERVDELAQRLGASKLVLRGNNVLSQPHAFVGDWVLKLCGAKGPLQLLALPAATPHAPAPVYVPVYTPAPVLAATTLPSRSSKICKIPPRARSCTSRFKGMQQLQQRGDTRGGSQPLDLSSPLSSPYSSPAGKAR